MKKVLLWTALLLALPAHAEWTKVPGPERGAVYVDLATIKVQGSDSNQRRAWFLFDLPKPLKGVRSIKALMDLDCENVTTRQVVATHFGGQMAEGKVLKEDRGMYGVDYIAPDDFMADVLKYVCAYDPKAR
jgi:hypothetical protein